MKITVFTVLVLLIGLSIEPAHGAGDPDSSDGGLAGDRPALEAATDYYQEGLAHKQAAWDHELRASTNSDSSHEQMARDAYKLAVQVQGKALKLHPQYYQAANELGYALRKSGEARKALGAYHLALAIKPDFFPAVEYRGEAYLALGKLAKTKAAYMTLFRNAPDLAATLLTVMDQTLEQWMTEDPANVDAGDRERLQAWVRERQTLAGMVSGESGDPEGWRAES